MSAALWKPVPLIQGSSLNPCPSTSNQECCEPSKRVNTLTSLKTTSEIINSFFFVVLLQGRESMLGQVLERPVCAGWLVVQVV